MAQNSILLPSGIPLVWRAPDAGARGVVIHIPAFTQRKEDAIPLLEWIAARDHVGVTLDARQHGERGHEDAAQLITRVFANFRREMWPIIGETTLDLPLVVRWVREAFDPSLPVHLTGLSMGGDIAVAAARLIPEAASINAVAATPDWTRPGMRNIFTGELVPTGTPDAKAQALYDRLEPLRHAPDYRTRAVHFILGAEDNHVPTDGAQRFKTKVDAIRTPRDPGGIRITMLAQKTHLDFVSDSWWPLLDFPTSFGS
jgi:pimeloyl-ACP methyl ester carboxylesterase